MANVVAAVWGTEFTQFLAPGWYEEKDELPQDEIILLFKSSWCKMAGTARNWINSAPKQQRRPLPFLLFKSFFYAPSIFVIGCWNCLPFCTLWQFRIYDEKTNFKAIFLSQQDCINKQNNVNFLKNELEGQCHLKILFKRGEKVRKRKETYWLVLIQFLKNAGILLIPAMPWKLRLYSIYWPQRWPGRASQTPVQGQTPPCSKYEGKIMSPLAEIIK